MAAAMPGPEIQGVTRPQGGGTARMRAERLAPLTGVAPLLLGLAGLIVLEGPADRPETDAPRVAILAYFGHRDTVIAGSFLLMLAAVLFLCFAGCLRDFLRSGHLRARRRTRPRGPGWRRCRASCSGRRWPR